MKKGGVVPILGFVLLLIMVIFLIGCGPERDTKLLQECCQDCLDAANLDPSGYDISIKPCSEYSFSASCSTYIADQKMLVKDCRQDIGQ